MGLLDLLSQGLNMAKDMADTYNDDLKKEEGHVKSMSDDKLKDKAMHGYSMAQRVAAMKELKNRGYGDQD